MRAIVFGLVLLGASVAGLLSACGEDATVYHCGYIVIPNTVSEGAIGGSPGTFQEFYEVVIEETGAGGFIPFLQGCDAYDRGRGRCFEDEDRFGVDLELRLRDQARNVTMTAQNNSIMACRKVKLFTCDGPCDPAYDYRLTDSLSVYNDEFGDQSGTCESNVLEGPPTCGRATFGK